MKEIKLSQFGKNRGKFVALVSDEDYELLKNKKWFAHKSRYNYYVETHEYDINGRQKKTIKMHRLIMNVPDDFQVDHIDGNTLNNQRHNLRICNHSQNMMHRERVMNKQYTSIYRGVCFHKHQKKYYAMVNHNHKRYYSRYFEKEICAALEHDEMAKKYHGEFANLNFK